MTAEPGTVSEGGGDRSGGGGSSLINASAVMAAGTVVSRLTGFVRTALLGAAIGAKLHADVFNIANTIPNALYILLAGGVFNAVLVPQLVRAMRSDPDRGDAYTNRIITLAALFLAGATAVLIIAAPWVMRLFLDPAFYTEPHLAAQRESVIVFARLCLPQVFFYGMYVLVGQVLNARGRFGPMMWAPIANNVISIAVIVAYIAAFGQASGEQLCGGYTRSQELVLGLGSTAGIAAQFLVLLPYLRAAGFTYRPRYDFRGTGLGHTLRLGIWTVLFVVVNQVAFAVVVRLASTGTADVAACSAGAGHGTGWTVFSTAFLLIMVPHSVITVSFATAMLPRLSSHAAEGGPAGLARVSDNVASTMRTTYAFILPFCLLVPVVAVEVSNLLFGYGAALRSVPAFATSLALFAPGLVFFTSHYLVLRGFYALERNRLVFWVQCVIAAVNIGLAVVLVHGAEPRQVAPALVVAYGGSYLVGAVLSYELLRRALGGLQTPRFVGFLARTLVAGGIATAAAWLVEVAIQNTWPVDEAVASKGHALVVLVVVSLVDAALFLGLARVMRIAEVNEVVALVVRRVRPTRSTP